MNRRRSKAQLMRNYQLFQRIVREAVFELTEGIDRGTIRYFRNDRIEEVHRQGFSRSAIQLALLDHLTNLSKSGVVIRHQQSTI